MRTFFYTIVDNIIALFRGRNIFWHILMIGLTLILVVSDFDWWYFIHIAGTPFAWVFSLAGVVGFFAPFIIGLVFFAWGWMSHQTRLSTAGWITAQAGFLGWLISSSYKVFTGRNHPPHITATNLIDTSHIFHFGIWQGGIFWGWPSSHTTVSFAIAFALIFYFREKKWIPLPALAYALYIAIGASASFHWFSDVAAGIILGTLIGVIVGKSFLADNLAS